MDVVRLMLPCLKQTCYVTKKEKKNLPENKSKYCALVLFILLFFSSMRKR